MVNFLILLCIVIALCGAGIVAKKVLKTEKYRKKYSAYQAPERAKNVSLNVDDASCDRELVQTVEVDEYEQQLFDDIAAIFFQKKYRIESQAEAEQLQADFLRKMPVCCKTQIRQLDLGEWSIYWTFYNQSLEYYLGRYGEFYTHVDRFGEEHKLEYKFQESAS